MTKMNTYQFVVNHIPDSELDRFLDWMEQFRNKTGCQFRYREKMGMKYTLRNVPPHDENAIQQAIQRGTWHEGETEQEEA